jgi:hypothetical protein
MQDPHEDLPRLYLVLMQLLTTMKEESEYPVILPIYLLLFDHLRQYTQGQSCDKPLLTRRAGSWLLCFRDSLRKKDLHIVAVRPESLMERDTGWTVRAQ